MTNAAFEGINDYRDVETLNYYEYAKLQGKPVDQTMKSIWAKSRDNARTPMQWDAGPHAGFTEGEPWIKVNENYTKINAADAMKDPNSIFHSYRKLPALRKNHKLIIYGKYKLLLPLDSELYVYTRTLEDETLLVILNFYENRPVFKWPEDLLEATPELLISNYEPLAEEARERFQLRPYDARVYKLV